jgi:hypothetical protein
VWTPRVIFFGFAKCKDTMIGIRPICKVDSEIVAVQTLVSLEFISARDNIQSLIFHSFEHFHHDILCDPFQ